MPLLACLVFAAPAATQDKQAGLTVDRAKGTITLDARIAPRKLPNLDQIYPIEVIACWPAPKGQKAHETVVTIDAKPSEVHAALIDLGLKPGKVVKGPGTPEGPAVKIFLLLPEGDGFKKVAIEKSVVDPRTNKPLPAVQWRFTGSVQSKPPDKDESVYGADLTGTLITIFPVTNETVFQTNLTIEQEKFIKLETNKAVLPKEGTAVKLLIEISKTP
jgi:hypothetical protein